MPVLMRHETPGITSEQAEALTAPIRDQLRTYPGFIAHSSGPTPGGYQVTEVWETQEAHERWLREVVVPTMRRAGMDQPLPPAQYLPLDQFFTR